MALAQSASREIGVESCSARKPQNALPHATPPQKIIWQVPSARACTQGGVEIWTVTFSVDSALVQANPAANNDRTISGTLRTSASVASVPANTSEEAATIESADIFCLRRGRNEAPTTAPAPRHPFSIP